jgi:flagellar assembly protein FliH
MSNTLPKEKQSAYERWELASFSEGSSHVSTSIRPSSIQAPAPSKGQIEQLEVVREQAKREGYAAGFAQGRSEAQEAGRAETKREVANLRRLADSFGSEIAAASDNISQDVLALALDLAKAMLKTSLAIKPDLVLPVVAEAIRYIPNLQQPALLLLHPQDAALVRERMGDELSKAGWRIAEDPQLARGGCRVETNSNQIDAAIETRWQRISEALGRQSDWLE